MRGAVFHQSGQKRRESSRTASASHAARIFARLMPRADAMKLVPPRVRKSSSPVGSPFGKACEKPPERPSAISPIRRRTIAVFLQLRLTPRRLLVRQNRVIGGDGLPLRLKPVRPTNRKDARAETHRQFGNRLPPVLFQRERAEPRARTGMVTTASARTAWVQAVMASTSAR